MRQIILCVDDEALILLSLTEELRGYFGQDYAYETASSAAEALEIIEEAEEEGDRIAVLVSDWLMPGMRGDELLQKVGEKKLAIPSIMLTGHADAEALQDMKDQDLLSAFIRKPWNGFELERLVRDCLGTRRAS